MNNKMDAASSTLVQLLDATAMRHRVLSNNLANVDTPGYTRKDVNFNRILRMRSPPDIPSKPNFK